MSAKSRLKKRMKREQRRRRKQSRKWYFKRFPDAIGWNVKDEVDIIRIMSDHFKNRTDCPAMFVDISIGKDKNPIVIAPKEYHQRFKQLLHHVPILPRFIVLDSIIKEIENGDSFTEGNPRPGSNQGLVRGRKS